MDWFKQALVNRAYINLVLKTTVGAQVQKYMLNEFINKFNVVLFYLELRYDHKRNKN